MIAMIGNALLLALRELRRNVMRSILTMLGIIIGVASVIILVTLGSGATKKVTEQIASLGSNLLMLSPGQTHGTRTEFRRGPVQAGRCRSHCPGCSLTRRRGPGFEPFHHRHLRQRKLGHHRHRHHRAILPPQQPPDQGRPRLHGQRGPAGRGGLCHRRDRADKVVRQPESHRQPHSPAKALLRSHRVARSQRPEHHGAGPGRCHCRSAAHLSTPHRRQRRRQHDSSLRAGWSLHRARPPGHHPPDARPAPSFLQRRTTTST